MMQDVTELPFNNAYPNAKQSWGIVGAMVLLSLLFAVPYSLSKGLIGDELSFFIYYVVYVGAVFLIFNHRRRSQGMRAPYPIKLGSVKVVVLLVVATIGLQLSVVTPLISLIPIPEFFRKIFLEMQGRTGLFSFLTIVVAAPVLEELIFRGIILDGLLKRYSPLYAIMLSSCLFGLVHLNPWQFITAVIIGSLSGWVYYHTRNLALSILTHLSNNLVAFLAMVVFKGEADFDTPLSEYYGGIFNMSIVLGIALAAAAVSLYLLKLDFSYRFRTVDNTTDIVE